MMALVVQQQGLDRTVEESGRDEIILSSPKQTSYGDHLTYYPMTTWDLFS
jgi:hypothetical protein